MAEDFKANRTRGSKGKDIGRDTKPATTMREVIYMVSRVVGSFDAVLRTQEPVLSRSQWAILETLDAEGGTARPMQLARSLAFSRQLIRQAAQKLIKLEFIGAEASDEDKKAVSLTLTDTGRAHLQLISKAIEGFAATMKEGKGGSRGDGLTRTARTLKGIVAALSTETKGNRRNKKAASGGARKVKTADAGA